MYESHFGLSSSPFLLNPDPSFFFDSKGHSSALSYLKFGLYQAEGFIVITGDIGAGKTTLVRTLLSDIDTEKIVAAQLVSTQLEAGDLLKAAITAFGITPNGNSKADLIATLEAYLTLLATQKKRAVLIVDEAQNLSRDAVEELRMLSNFQFGNQALLQSFLIGQPELRNMLLSRSLEQLRQRVIASYHLGPMDRDETRRYIEHRLSKVGWTGERPRISADAFDELYDWTSGIPRRINLLCNRVLLAAFLADEQEISASNVARIAHEIRSEIGEPVVTTQSKPSPLTPVSAPTHQPDQEVPQALGHSHEPPFTESLGTPSDEPFFLCITGSRTSCLRASPLMQAFKARADAPPLKRLHIGIDGPLEIDADWSEHLGLKAPDFQIRLSLGNAIQHLSDMLGKIAALLSKHRPLALLIQSGEDSAMAVNLAAQRLGIPCIHMEAGLRSFDRARPEEGNAIMCDHMSQLLLTSEWVAHDNLSREGIPADRVVFVGSLLMDAIKAIRPQSSEPKYTLRQLDLATDLLKHRHGFGLVYLQKKDRSVSQPEFNAALNVMRMISKDLPLLWPMHAQTQSALDELGFDPVTEGREIMRLPLVPYHKMLGLLSNCTFIITDSPTLQEEATILGIPCLTIENFTTRRITIEQGTNTMVGLNSGGISRAVTEILQNGGKKGRLPKFWDGQTAARITQHLLTWLDQQGLAVRIIHDSAQSS